MMNQPINPAGNMCTCKDTSCPNHPTNHHQGCTLCIAKNLGTGEIPACFFHRAGSDESQENYYFEDFAKLVLEKRK